MDKGKGKQIAEEEPPPWRKRMIAKGEEASSSTTEELYVPEPNADYGSVLTYENYLNEDSWDWRDDTGVIGYVVDQRHQATFWAVSLIRAVQALYNIGISIQEQQELSIQHIVNNVNYNPDMGIQNIKTALNYMVTSGVCKESQCKQHGGELKARRCFHYNAHFFTLDSFTHLTEIEDVDLRAVIRRQPVLAFMPVTDNLFDYYTRDNTLIYQHDRSNQDPETTVMHTILIVRYGNCHGRPYWIIQNSWGAAWGHNGYTYVYRQTVRGRSLSQFARVFIPEKRVYPRQPPGRPPPGAGA